MKLNEVDVTIKARPGVGASTVGLEIFRALRKAGFKTIIIDQDTTPEQPIHKKRVASIAELALVVVRVKKTQPKPFMKKRKRKDEV